MEFWMFDTLLGTMAVGEEDGYINRVYLPNSPMPRLMPHKTPLLERAQEQITEYFDGRRQEFDLPLTFAGTDFQKKVWHALTEIPYGETVTYGALAERIGCPGGARAVGAANHCNPLPILVPCHRVVGAGGNLTGYAGGVEMKKALLELEQGKNPL